MNTLGNNNKHRHLATLAYSAGRVCLVLVFALGLAGGVALAAPLAATAPALGTAANFVVLGGAGVTCTDSTITGVVGSLLTVIPTPTCNIVGPIHQGDATAIQAFNDFSVAYLELAAVPSAGAVAAKGSARAICPVPNMSAIANVATNNRRTVLLSG